MRKLAPGGAAALLSLVFATGALGVGSAPKPPLVEKPQPPVKADRDGDKLFEDLEARLASMPANGELSVIVTLTVPASQERLDELKRRVGAFTATHRFSLIQGLAARVNRGQVEALTHVPWVEHVEENSPVQATNDGAQASFGVAKARADQPSLDGDLESLLARLERPSSDRYDVLLEALRRGADRDVDEIGRVERLRAALGRELELLRTHPSLRP